MNDVKNVVNQIITYLPDFNNNQIDKIKQAAYIVLNNYDVHLKKTDIAIREDDIKQKAISMFFISKKVEGCTPKTIGYYKGTLDRFFAEITYPLDEITADSIRYYLAIRSTRDNLSKVSQDNELRVLKSFFKFCGGEGYTKNIPTLNIKSIKKEKRIKKAFSETELERLREGATNKRDRALIDVLYSTGARASEVSNMNISDINNDEIIVFGKGEKERVCYLNARAKLSVEEYLKTRTDDNNALFVSLRKPYTRLTKGGIEVAIRSLGNKLNINKVHPHRFRRTTATIALNRGMPLEEVQQMLGHEDIGTTTIYARSEQNNVKTDHRKCII